MNAAACSTPSCAGRLASSFSIDSDIVVADALERGEEGRPELGPVDAADGPEYPGALGGIVERALVEDAGDRDLLRPRAACP